MKYNLYLNQVALKEFGINNVNQGLIFDLLTTASSWATPIIIDKEVYYWVARQKIVEELWILNLKADTAYRHLRKLAEFGVIEYKKQGKKDCIRLTIKGKRYLSTSYIGNESEKDTNSEMNPTKLGNESENNSEMNPTYNTTKSNTTTNNTKNKQKSQVADTYPQIINDWIQYRKEIKKPITKTTINRLNKKYEANPYELEQQINQSIENGWQGLFEKKGDKIDETQKALDKFFGGEQREVFL